MCKSKTFQYSRVETDDRWLTIEQGFNTSISCYTITPLGPQVWWCWRSESGVQAQRSCWGRLQTAALRTFCRLGMEMISTDSRLNLQSCSVASQEELLYRLDTLCIYSLSISLFIYPLSPFKPKPGVRSTFFIMQVRANRPKTRAEASTRVLLGSCIPFDEATLSTQIQRVNHVPCVLSCRWHFSRAYKINEKIERRPKREKKTADTICQMS